MKDKKNGEDNCKRSNKTSIKIERKDSQVQSFHKLSQEQETVTTLETVVRKLLELHQPLTLKVNQNFKIRSEEIEL